MPPKAQPKTSKQKEKATNKTESAKRPTSDSLNPAILKKLTKSQLQAIIDMGTTRDEGESEDEDEDKDDFDAAERQELEDDPEADEDEDDQGE